MAAVAEGHLVFRVVGRVRAGAHDQLPLLTCSVITSPNNCHALPEGHQPAIRSHVPRNAKLHSVASNHLT